MDKSAQRYNGNVALSRTAADGFGDNKTIKEEDLERVFTDQ